MTDRIPKMIDCHFCGEKFDMSATAPLTRLEVYEHHRRGCCVRKLI